MLKCASTVYDELETRLVNIIGSDTTESEESLRETQELLEKLEMEQLPLDREYSDIVGKAKKIYFGILNPKVYLNVKQKN
ncbi:MAG: hypothetical protein OQK82_02960 [Candidatus Pacearchaeota archaeon]|nr:hypothetical protein [Candidatus Pacearchaeota archaeon]